MAQLTASLDTNVLVRYLVRDDEAQFELARQLIEPKAQSRETLYIPISVTLELEWVLRACYGFDKKTVTYTYTRLLQTTELKFESESAVEIALFYYKMHTADFADCLHSALAAQATHVPLLTFDKKATRIPGTRGV
jgi:predicted nucleic-acid-binding protein